MSNGIIINSNNSGLYKLTIAEILYFLPDYKDLLQSYVWQDYDYLPHYPNLRKFLEFWDRELEGKIHSVRVSVRDHGKINQVNVSSFSREIN